MTARELGLVILATALIAFGYGYKAGYPTGKTDGMKIFVKEKK